MPYTRSRCGRRIKKINYADPNTDDSEIEIIEPPPRKRQKLNTKKAKPIQNKIASKSKRRRRRTPKSSTDSSTTHNIPKRTPIIPPLPTLSELEDDTDSDYDYNPNKRKTRKKKKVTRKSKTKKRKQKKNKTKKQIKKIKKSKKNTIHFVCVDLDARKVDLLIDGYFRRQFQGLEQQTLPVVITKMINSYRANIKYIIINFVWTHKYQCNCYRASRCAVLKRNRGRYIFEREPSNSFDENAIAIRTDDGAKHVGYIDRFNASTLAPLMDSFSIELKSIGGIGGKPCAECVEIVQLNEYESLPSSLQNILERKHYESFKRIISA